MLRASPKNKSADHSVPSKKSGSNSDSNNNNDGSSKRRKVSVQAAMKQWAFESLSLARFNVRTVRVTGFAGCGQAFLAVGCVSLLPVLVPSETQTQESEG